MAIVRFSPLNEVVDLQQEMNKLFENFFPAKRGNQEEYPSAVWRPVVDIHEDENSFIIDAELPGLSKDDVKINFQDDTMTISGERRYTREERQANGNGAVNGNGGTPENARQANGGRPSSVHRMERVYGKFIRSFTFPKKVSADGIRATFENGVLTIVAPKAEAAKPRQISIG
jgi:HSP20 family protein